MKKNYILLLFLLCFIPGLAQNKKTPKPNDLDKVFTPPENSILGGKPGKGKRMQSASGFRNIIKWNPTLLTRGTIGFLYERWLSDRISVMGGIGKNFARDLGQTNSLVAYMFEDMVGNFSRSTIPLDYILTNGQLTSDIHPFFSGNFRYYFGSFAEQSTNTYIDFGIRFSQYTVDLNKSNFGADIFDLGNNNYYRFMGSAFADVRNTSYTLNFGFQKITSGTIKTAHNLYFGPGLRKTSVPVFYQTATNTISYSGSSYSEYFQSKSSTRENHFVPMLMVGYVFGIAF